MGYKIGDEFIGYKFDDNIIADINFHKDMKRYVGKVGKIIKIWDDRVTVKFDCGTMWSYPNQKN